MAHTTEAETQYNEACHKAGAAYGVFEPIRQAYRAGLVNENTFLAARAAHEAALAEYDKAYAEAECVVEASAR